MTVTRNYGDTAKEKSNELLYHMLIAVVSVSILVAIVLGLRESLIVFTAIPVTLALTLTVFYLYGCTLNRITLFALIFSIGILVDDAIVVVENIVRHWRMAQNQGRPPFDVAIEAVDEVGNPTILATLAVVAFVVTPWAAVRILKSHGVHHAGEREDFVTRLYRRFMGNLLHRPLFRWAFLGGVVLLLLGSCSLVYIGFVKVKMLPFDNKSEFQVIVDMPDGTTLEQTERVVQLFAEETQKQREVVNVQTYAGTASPYNFNGLVRHYYLRCGPNVADIQVNLLPKDSRELQSHEIAKQVRQRLLPVAERYGARIKVAEVPPGPPVLETLVAEVYVPSMERRVALARQIRDLFRQTKGVVDVDWYVEDDQTKYRLLVDEEKAALNGISKDDIVRAMHMASGGYDAGLLHQDSEKEDIPLTVRLDRATRSDLDRIRNLKIAGRGARLVALSELVHTEKTI
jgi:multidrug efflux pump subunit AcrB